MQKTEYNKEYFQGYLQRSRFFKSASGERSSLYGYWIRYLTKHFPANTAVLEVGCGLGFFGKRLQEKFSYTGLDVSLDALTHCREVNHIKSTVQSGAESLPFTERHFDIIIAFDVVEHLKEPSLFFNEAFRVLKNSGMLILSTPNINSFGVRIKAHSKVLTASMYKDGSHVSLLDPAHWTALVQTAGFTEIKQGTDTLWDIPYFEHIPMVIQKIIFMPFNLFVLSVFGFLPWKQGENLMLIGWKKTL